MNTILRASAAFLLFLSFHQLAHAAPNPEAVNPEIAPLIQVTMHRLENGEKKSSQSIAAQDGGSAETFSVANNKTFERNFFNPEMLDNGKVMVRLHQCTGPVTPEQLQNPSSINCDPTKMNRLNFEASFTQPTIVETTGAGGEKQEYYIFVEKLSSGSKATTL